jgi:hypothetical protein
MISLVLRRRQFLSGMASLAICAPAIVRASSLMPVSTKHLGSVAPWATAEEALGWVQRELERRFADLLFGEENSSSTDDGVAPNESLAIADLKTTALWELRTRLSPYVSRPPDLYRAGSVIDWAEWKPRPFAELPAHIQASVVSTLGAPLDNWRSQNTARMISS